jgi:uncharacterized protein
MSDFVPGVDSPCVRDCCLDDDLVCVGCFRSMEEIKAWGLADDGQRRMILQKASRRRDAAREPQV